VRDCIDSCCVAAMLVAGVGLRAGAGGEAADGNRRIVRRHNLQEERAAGPSNEMKAEQAAGAGVLLGDQASKQAEGALQRAEDSGH
jgi:hypothetical protein